MSTKSEPLRQATIEVRVRELGQIFNLLDPSPFTERDLDVMHMLLTTNNSELARAVAEKALDLAQQLGALRW
jgi:hypothetical protein